ncbi:MAG: peroxiredoxin [Clostridiales bacterium]|jgi:peroxiredoxin (alkyl hydroperoxide reductase subunit C)|nr:peroxiredoxin [Clostridiales bacterium]
MVPGQTNHLSLGMKAPDFSANTTFGPIQFSDYKGKWVVFFSHPGDFTPVCTTEFLAFAQAFPKFKELNAQLLGLSIDSNPSHLAWVYAIYAKTGVTIPFPVVADRTGAVARKYGMIAPDASTQETVRNVFIIDPEQIIRAILIYPLTNGRSIPEILRLLEALQTTDRDRVVTPANWQPGQPALVPPPQTYGELLERQNNPEKQNLNCKDWFWCYKQLPSSET